MDKKDKVPEIRFTEFTDSWKEFDIIDVAPLQRGFDLPSRTMKEGPFPVVMSNGINGFHCEYKAIAPGVVTGRSGTIGKLHYIESNYWPHNTALWVTNFYGNSPLYIFYMYQDLDLKRFGSGSGVPTLNRNDVHDTKIYLPNLNEQEKNAFLFKQLDSLLSLHQRKYDKLINLKKSMLDKMFPKDGADVPEIRFAGFSEPWIEKSLGEVAKDTHGGGTPQTSIRKYWNGDIAWIQSSDLKDGELSNIIPQKYITEIGINESATKLVPENSIAIVTRVGVGKLAYMSYKYTTSQDFLSLSELKIDDWFAVYSIWKKLQTELHSVQGTSIKGITKEELLSKRILVPKSIEEQLRIGSYFRKNDRLTSLKKHELEILRKIKKAFLEKMFV